MKYLIVIREVKEMVKTGEEGKKQIAEETKMVKRQDSFIPYSVACDVDWTDAKYASRLKRASPSIFILNGICTSTVWYNFKCIYFFIYQNLLKS